MAVKRPHLGVPCRSAHPLDLSTHALPWYLKQLQQIKLGEAIRVMLRLCTTTGTHIPRTRSPKPNLRRHARLQSPSSRPTSVLVRFEHVYRVKHRTRFATESVGRTAQRLTQAFSICGERRFIDTCIVKSTNPDAISRSEISISRTLVHRRSKHPCCDTAGGGLGAASPFAKWTSKTSLRFVYTNQQTRSVPDFGSVCHDAPRFSGEVHVGFRIGRKLPCNLLGFTTVCANPEESYLFLLTLCATCLNKVVLWVETI
jgi:hypothetical protein